MISLMVLRPGLPGVALAACVMFASPVFAETVSFKADLKASEAVPPNDSKGTGTVTATYDTASKKLTWKGNYSGLTGPATMAHLRAGRTRQERRRRRTDYAEREPVRKFGQSD